MCFLLARPLTYIKELMERIFNKTVFIFRPVAPSYTHEAVHLLHDSSHQKYILSNETGSWIIWLLLKPFIQKTLRPHSAQWPTSSAPEFFIDYLFCSCLSCLEPVLKYLPNVPQRVTPLMVTSPELDRSYLIPWIIQQYLKIMIIQISQPCQPRSPETSPMIWAFM